MSGTHVGCHSFLMAAAASLLDAASIQPDVLDLEFTWFRKNFACAVPAKDAVSRPFSDNADFFTQVCCAFQIHDHEGFQSNDSTPKTWCAQCFRKHDAHGSVDSIEGITLSHVFYLRFDMS